MPFIMHVLALKAAWVLGLATGRGVVFEQRRWTLVCLFLVRGLLKGRIPRLTAELGPESTYGLPRCRDYRN
jgi:hypothetical protein